MLQMQKSTNRVSVVVPLFPPAYDNSWPKKHFDAKCTHFILILGVFTPILGVATRFLCSGGGGVPKFTNIRHVTDSEQ